MRRYSTSVFPVPHKPQISMMATTPIMETIEIIYFITHLLRVLLTVSNFSKEKTCQILNKNIKQKKSQKFAIFFTFLADRRGLSFGQLLEGILFPDFDI